MSVGAGATDEKPLIDLFCGAGGSALGFQRAGFLIALGIDIDPEGLKTFNQNLQSKALHANLFEMDPEEILSSAGLDRNETAIQLGCPPCQGFSGLNDKGVRDRRNDLVHRYVDAVRIIRPLFLVFENVPRIMDREAYFDRTLHSLRGMGYHIRYELVDMRDFGVPQRRTRLVIVGCRDKKIMKRFLFPEKTHAGNPENESIAPWRTVRDAISDLQPLAAGWRSSRIPNHIASSHSESIMKKILSVPKNGGSRRQMPRRLWYKCHKGKNGFNDVLGRMAWDEPSPTITTGCCNPTRGRYLHPQQNRAITPREAARLQTFPDDFVFAGGIVSITRQIGNAFPPLYSEKLGRRIIAAMASEGS